MKRGSRCGTRCPSSEMRETRSVLGLYPLLAKMLLATHCATRTLELCSSSRAPRELERRGCSRKHARKSFEKSCFRL